MMDRTNRIANEMQKEISDIIRNSIKDPRIPELVSVTAVRVTKDLRYARVYISVFGSEKEKRDAMAALKSASGFVRREIGQRVQLRYTPEITFSLDDSIEHGIHISNLINETIKSDKNTKNTND
ncbi:MAG: 30S ribosome-binding factor RbfA [Clostridiaceae bacterium]|nr:30S ribosome-binding factor RbfA [Clostridiaceae bacterium]